MIEILTLAKLTRLMKQTSLADIRQATREQRSDFELAARGMLVTIGDENKHDDADKERREAGLSYQQMKQ